MHRHSNKATQFVVTATYHKGPKTEEDQGLTYQKHYTFKADAPIQEIFDAVWPKDGAWLHPEIPYRLDIAPDEQCIPAEDDDEPKTWRELAGGGGDG